MERTWKIAWELLLRMSGSRDGGEANETEN